MWRARPASREPGLPRASALAASSRSAVPALARAPRSWPRVGASRTAASPVFLGPVPRGNPPRPRGARGWARPHLLWSRLAVEGVRAPRWWSVPCGRGVVGVAVDEGRSVALRWLSVCVWVLRWGRRGRPLAGLARSPGAAHPPACVEGERGRERREVVSPVALRGRVWRPASVRPSLPRWAPSRRTRPLGAVGARGPRGSSSSPLLLHPGGTRSGAGPRDAAASVRRCESPPGVASSGRERASLTRCVPASLGGTRRLWAVRPGGCVRVRSSTPAALPSRRPLGDPLRRFAGSSSRAAGCRLFPARLLALFFPRLGACPPFLTATSDQTWRPAEFKHISQRRKRN